MYESHFGFSGSPFQLNPDPAFYFDSRGHSNALAYLKFGAHQGEGFIVVTGEIGAGKTTLVRTLLEGLNPEQVVAAQVVSTQLESSELLQAILMAFGIPSPNPSKAHLIANLEAYLTTLAAKGRRALLIIDEAQNLKHEAVEELRMLSNFQLGKYGLLQSFLVGQPELRGLLQSKSMEQLRQRVIASCHLGPLDEAETRAYVEHRLKRVGWNGSLPGFAPGTFEAVHRWTGGVPRKINRLCNRMLLGAFLANANAISLALVDETATELRNEIGEAVATPPPPAPVIAAAETAPVVAAPPPPPPPPPPAPAPAPPPAPSAPALRAEASAGVAAAAGEPRPNPSAASAPAAAPAGVAASLTPASESIPVPAITGEVPVAPRRADVVQPAPRAPIDDVVHRPGVATTRPVVCIVDSPAAYLKAGLLQDVFEGFPSLPGVVALHLGDPARLDAADLRSCGLPLPARGMHLGLPSAPFAARSAHVFDAVDALFDQLHPSAVMVFGNSDDDLACAMLANKRGLRLLRVGSGQRDARADPGRLLNAVLIERLADLHFTDSTESFYALYREGIRLDRVRSVGNLTNEMLDHALAQTTARGAGNAPTPEAQRAPQGYGVVDVVPAAPDTPVFADTLRRLTTFGAALPLVWAVDAQAYPGLAGSAHAEVLKAARIALVRDTGYSMRLELLRGAKCLVTDRDSRLWEEATALQIPTIALDPIEAPAAASDGAAPQARARDGAADPADLQRLLTDRTSSGAAPEYWHIGTASRIAGHLVTWLAKSAPKAPAGPTAEEPAAAERAPTAAGAC